MARSAPCWLGPCAALLLAARAAAQPTPCGDLASAASAELEVTPEDRAQDVARNAPVIVRHPHGEDLGALLRELAEQAASGDACSSEPVCLFRDAREQGGGARQPVPGELQQLDARSLAFVPSSLLEPETDYFAVIARTGFDRASRTELEFRTGTGLDREPPQLAGEGGRLRLAIDAPPPECDAPGGSVRVRVGVPHARDDGGAESVELLLFVTRAEGVDGPVLRARRRNRADGEVVLTWLLSAREAERPVCVAVRAVDALGRVSRGEPSLCFEPGQGSHFAPLCSAAQPPRRAYGGAGTLVLSSAWLAIALRRRGRGRARRPPPFGARQCRVPIPQPSSVSGRSPTWAGCATVTRTASSSTKS